MAIINDDQLVERLVPKILSSIRAKSKPVESLSVKADLNGITSLPCYDTTGGQFKNVLVSINALKEPAVEAAETADAATASANAAAAEANAAADRVTEAILDLADEKLAVMQVVDNEKSRIANEEARQENEDGRIAAEQARAQEETLRQQAENAREVSEEVRESAEAARQANEQERVSQETERHEAEERRIRNEEDRISAETERVAADNERKRDYEALKEDLVANSQIVLVSEKEYEDAVDSGIIDSTKLYFAYEEE